MAFFVRVDDPEIAIQVPPRWWKEDSEGYVLVENRRVPHLAGRLQLFVAADDGKPTCVMLNREDARKYFGVENTEFVNAEAFLAFWNDVLEKEYLSRDTR